MKDINECLINEDNCEMNLLHIACGIESIYRDQVVKYLVSLESLNINQPSGPGNDYFTGLHITACYGFASTLQILLEHKANPYLCDINCNNAWDLASAFDHFPCIFVLENFLNHQSFSDTSSSKSIESILNDTVIYSTSNSILESTKSSIALNKSSDAKVYFDPAFNLTFLEYTSEPSERKITLCDKNYSSSTPTKDEDQDFENLSNMEIRERLIALGESPGPIIDSTRPVYIHKLKINRKALFSPSPQKSSKTLPFPKYSIHLNNICLGTFDFHAAKRLEKKFIEFYETETNPKNYFTYLLLDPRETQNLTSESGQSKNKSLSHFMRFLKSIFYIGKGQGNRPYMHLYEAALNMDRKQTHSKNSKIEKILEIWNSGYGVISLHCFHSITSNEAFTRECIMIDTIGVDNLTNIKIGKNNIKSLLWTDHKKLTFGAYLLYKAYNMLLINGERQVRKADIQPNANQITRFRS